MESEPARPKETLACPGCGNRLRMRPDLVGSDIICPKCNAKFSVGRPDAPPPVPVSDDDAYEPEIPLRRSSIVPENELIESEGQQAHSPTYDEHWTASGELEAEEHYYRLPGAEVEHLAMARAKGMIRTEIYPDPPQWTFFSGVFTFPWQGSNVTHGLDRHVAGS